MLQALVPLFIEEDEDVLLAVWTATGAATAAVPKVRYEDLSMCPTSTWHHVGDMPVPAVCLL